MDFDFMTKKTVGPFGATKFYDGGFTGLLSQQTYSRPTEKYGSLFDTNIYPFKQ